ncbi:MAG: flippase-like domain-containing protein [Alphaproteobacteria bacterium]|nr:flippase-like domain-containing protein [Alphaproteobacteria bacterium]
MMRIVSIVAAILGLLLGTFIVGYYGFGDVWSALRAIRWSGFAVVCLYHLGLLGLLGVAWYTVLPPPRSVGPGALIWGRIVRDAGAEVLPLSQLGGFAMGARAVTIAGLPGTLSLASTVVDVTLETLAQLVYAAVGLGLLVWFRPNAAIAKSLGVGLIVAVFAVFAFIFVQRRGMGVVERLAERLAPRWLPDAAEHTRALNHHIHMMYMRMVGPQLGFVLHLAGWFANGIEAWIALHLMGVPLGIGAVLTIESLLYALRSFAFFVPNAVGVQEGAYVVLGALFGLSPEIALALSLLKRGRDLTIGVPALLVWQGTEGRRALRAGRQLRASKEVR